MKTLLVLTAFLVASLPGALRKHDAASKKAEEAVFLEAQAFNDRALFEDIGCAALKDEAAIVERMRFIIQMLDKQEEYVSICTKLLMSIADTTRLEMPMKKRYIFQSRLGGSVIILFPGGFDAITSPDAVTLILRYLQYEKGIGMVFRSENFTTPDKQYISSLLTSTDTEVKKVAQFFMDSCARDSVVSEQNKLARQFARVTQEMEELLPLIQADPVVAKYCRHITVVRGFALGYASRIQRNGGTTEGCAIDIKAAAQATQLYKNYLASACRTVLHDIKRLLVQVQQGSRPIGPSPVKKEVKRTSKQVAVIDRQKQESVAAAAGVAEDESIIVPERDSDSEEMQLRDALLSIIKQEACWLPRVALWCGDAAAQHRALALKEYEEHTRFSDYAGDSLIKHHGFDRAVDTFIPELAIIVPWKQEGTFSVNIPGQICFSDGRIENGVFSWGVNLHERCVFHRSFAKKVIEDIQALVRIRRYDAEFPPYAMEKAFAPIPCMSISSNVTDKGMYIEIFDSRNNMTIRLFKIKK